MLNGFLGSGLLKEWRRVLVSFTNGDGIRGIVFSVDGFWFCCGACLDLFSAVYFLFLLFGLCPA
jgi:hypothetical protein